MSSDSCSHNCGGCNVDCSDRQEESLFAKLNEHSKVKKVIGIVSGKGGVGKSLVTSLLAVAAQRKGLRAAIMDADITGPSIPKSFGVHEKARASQMGMMPSLSSNGIQIMSLNLISENETDPVIWRGPVIAGVVKQFWTDVVWKDVDIMFIDMPPGTGDVPLTVFQSIPVDGIVIVSSPQELVGMMDKEVIALVENMSYLKCPDCGKEIKIFGESNIEKIAKKHNIKLTAKLPIDPSIASLVDSGKIEESNVSALDEILEKILSK